MLHFTFISRPSITDPFISCRASIELSTLVNSTNAKERSCSFDSFTLMSCKIPKYSQLCKSIPNISQISSVKTRPIFMDTMGLLCRAGLRLQNGVFVMLRGGFWFPGDLNSQVTINWGFYSTPVNSLMFVGINVRIFETKPCSWGLKFAVSWDRVSYLGTTWIMYEGIYFCDLKVVTKVAK